MPSPRPFVMQAYDWGINPLDLLEVERLKLAEMFRRNPPVRALLTMLVRLQLRAECTCKKCEAKRKREEKAGLCYHEESLKAVRELLPAWAEAEGIEGEDGAREALRVDLGTLAERNLGVPNG